MSAGVAADLLVIVHFMFIVFVSFGGFLVFKWRKVMFYHLPCVLWGVLMEMAGWECPLTPLENYFRKAAGEQGFSSGFIDHYLMPFIYPVGLTREMQIFLGVMLLVINLCVYGLVIARRARMK